MQARIVVTGFGPWGDNVENPTLEVLDQLADASGIDGDLTLLRLPVESSRITAITEQALDEIRPELWISLGLAAGLSVVAVERIAANVMDFAIPDNAGAQHQGQPIFADGPAAHMATLPVTSIATRLRNSGIPAKVSNSASTFLCNQMMYTVLHLIAEKRMNTRAGFIHVPAHPRLAALSGQSEMPSMSVDLMTRAVKAAIEVSLAEIAMLATNPESIQGLDGFR